MGDFIKLIDKIDVLFIIRSSYVYAFFSKNELHKKKFINQNKPTEYYPPFEIINQKKNI